MSQLRFSANTGVDVQRLHLECQICRPTIFYTGCVRSTGTQRSTGMQGGATLAKRALAVDGGHERAFIHPRRATEGEL